MSFCAIVQYESFSFDHHGMTERDALFNSRQTTRRFQNIQNVYGQQELNDGVMYSFGQQLRHARKICDHSDCDCSIPIGVCDVHFEKIGTSSISKSASRRSNRCDSKICSASLPVRQTVD